MYGWYASLSSNEYFAFFSPFISCSIPQLFLKIRTLVYELEVGKTEQLGGKTLRGPFPTSRLVLNQL